MRNMTGAAVLGLIVALATSLATSHAHAADAPAAAAACLQCHGPRGEGNEQLGAPRLAGQHAAYLARQLGNYKAGRRAYHPDDKQGALMRAAAARLNDGEIRSLADYFSRLDVPPTARKTAHADAEKGKLLYETSCVACHGQYAQGYPQLQAPRLNILSRQYMGSQIKAFVSGMRGDDRHADQPSVWMRSIAGHVSDGENLDAVLRYIESHSSP